MAGLCKITGKPSDPLNTISGAIAPHLDFKRGGRVYSSTYSKLYHSSKPDLIIAFGTSHRSGNSPFIMTEKNYETPYGDVETDREVYNRF
jgi:AmmeMemoRadiSam system protein B